MNEYTIATEHHLERFTAMCNDLISNGWAPQGGLTSVVISAESKSPSEPSSVILWQQAFVR